MIKKLSLCGFAVALVCAAAPLAAEPTVHLDSQAEWGAAIGSRISPMSDNDWLSLDSGFRANMGTGEFVASTVWASGGGTL